MVFRATVANLESKVETLTTSNTLIKEELDMANNSYAMLKEENQLIKNQLFKQNDSKNVDIEFLTLNNYKNKITLILI